MRSLIKMLGSETVEAFDEIKIIITESNLVKALLLRYGTQIFKNKNVRDLVLSRLEECYSGYYLDGKFEVGRVLNSQEKKQVLSKKWGRNYITSRRLLEIFGLSDMYLPPEYIPLPVSEIINPEVFLYPYQRRVKDVFIRKLIHGDERLLVHMPTGSGKTRTCIEGLIDYWRAFANRSGYIVWLAHSEELCEQAVDSFKNLWSKRGDEEIEIIRLWGSRDAPSFSKNSGIIVASLQSLHAMKMSNHNDIFMKIATLKRKCRIIVIDEAHKAIAKTYKSSIEFISNAETKIVGLTATPYRGDNIDENQRLVKFFNQGKVTLVSKSGDEIDNPIHYLQEKHYLARVTRKVVKTNISVDLTSAEKKFVSTFLDLPSSVLEKLANDAQRNVLILGEIAELVQNNKYIIVFALSVSHARLLSELLVMKGVEARSIDGDTDTYDREKYIQEYKDKNIQVLVNYGVLTTGFDAPNTNAVVITRPTSSLVLYSQMLGRGIRGVNMGGNSECQLVDIIDNINGFPDEKQAFTYYNSVWES